MVVPPNGCESQGLSRPPSLSVPLQLRRRRLVLLAGTYAPRTPGAPRLALHKISAVVNARVNLFFDPGEPSKDI